MATDVEPDLARHPDMLLSENDRHLVTRVVTQDEDVQTDTEILQQN